MSGTAGQLGVVRLFSSLLFLLLQTVSATDPASGATPASEAMAADPAGETVAADPAAAPVVEVPPLLPAAILLPKGHPIVIAIDKEVGSKVSQTGEVFPIRLAQAVEIDGVEVLPAGITGEGQVVHAKKGGLAGSAGELILAARYLDHDGRRIALRSFKFIEAGDKILSRGQDNIDLAAATNAVIGPLGFLIGGGNTTIAPGTLATAKIRDDETFERPAAAPDNSQVPIEEGVQ